MFNARLNRSDQARWSRVRPRSATAGERHKRRPHCEILEPRVLLQGDGIVRNAVSRFEIAVDGLFTNGVDGQFGAPVGEWSDVEPQAFISPADPEGQLVRTELTDPNANALTYAAIAPGVSAAGVEDLYLMYAYSPRTSPFFAPGEFIADVRFPVQLPDPLTEGSRQVDITVQFRGAGGGELAAAALESSVAGCAAGHQIVVDQNGDGAADSFVDSFFDVFVQLDLPEGPQRISAEELGIEGCVGFGLSPLETGTPHLLVELEVPLRIPAGFGDLDGDGEQDGNEPFPPAGINPATGLYDPNPKFWGADVSNDALDPPASANVIEILPDGTTVLDASFLPTPAVKDPGFPYVDANNDGLFDADNGDVPLLAGELADCKFDTAIAEGGYAAVIAGAGLGIHGAAITCAGQGQQRDLDIAADGNVVVNTDLSAEHDVELTSRFGDVRLDDPTLTAGADVEITAARDIIATGDVMNAGAEVELAAGHDINVARSVLRGSRKIELEAGGSIIANLATVESLGRSGSEVEMSAVVGVQADIALIRANKAVRLEAETGSISSSGSLLQALASGGKVELEAGGSIDVDDATMFMTTLPTVASASNKVKLEAGDDILASGSFFLSLGTSGKVAFDAGDDVVIERSVLRAADKLEIKAVDLVLGHFAQLLACGGSSSEVKVEAGGLIELSSATVRAGKKIKIESKHGDVDVRLGSIAIVTGSTTGDVEIKAKKIFIDGVTILAPHKRVLKGKTAGTAAVIGAGTLPCP